MHGSSSFSFFLAVLALGCGSDPIGTRETDANNWPAAALGPAGVGPGVRVWSGPAATLSGGTACTSEEGSEDDRWCVFIGLSSEGKRNLFAVNVSQVMAGVAVSCDAPDANCLLLTEEQGGSSRDWHPTYFAGDTLVYYDQTLKPYVWRPGMEAGRLLAAPESPVDAPVDVAFCTPAARGPAVACLAIPIVQPDVSVVVAELYIGSADGESEPLLAPVDSVFAATLDDTAGLHRFKFGSPASGYIAWSSRQTVDGPEVLKLQHVDDPTSLITVASDVHDWEISPDGTQWVWLSAANELGFGVLQTASFPDGANPTDLLPSVAAYSLDSGGSLVALTSDAEVVSILDPAGAPEKQFLIDSEVASLVSLSDRGHVAYAKHSMGTSTVDFFVSRLDGKKACSFERSVNVSRNSIHFSPGGETALWARSTAVGYDAYHSRVADCSTVSVAPDIVVLGWMGRGNAVFIDDFDKASATGSLRYRNVGKNGELHPAAPTLIAEHVDTYATWGPALLYSITARSDEDGLYVRAFGQ